MMSALERATRLVTRGVDIDRLAAADTCRCRPISPHVSIVSQLRGFAGLPGVVRVLGEALFVGDKRLLHVVACIDLGGDAAACQRKRSYGECDSPVHCSPPPL